MKQTAVVVNRVNRAAIYCHGSAIPNYPTSEEQCRELEAIAADAGLVVVAHYSDALKPRNAFYERRGFDRVERAMRSWQRDWEVLLFRDAFGISSDLFHVEFFRECARRRKIRVVFANEPHADAIMVQRACQAVDEMQNMHANHMKFARERGIAAARRERSEGAGASASAGPEGLMP